MLLHRRLGHFGAELFDIRGNRDRLDVIEPETMILAPVEELLDRSCIRGPGITIADSCSEEFDKAAVGALAMLDDRRRQRIHTGAYQRRSRRNFIG
jgi:hypothetical protein